MTYTAQDYINAQRKRAQQRLNEAFRAEHKQRIRPDYEPEQGHGTAEDFLKHKQYGGTREDY